MHTDTIRPADADPNGLRRAATIGLGGALVTVVGGAFSQLMRGSSSVSTEQWSFPFTARAHVLLTVVWALTHALLFVGFNGLRRSGFAGDRRIGGVGLKLALAGTALLGAGEVASMWLANATEDSGGAVAVGSVFGVGTLLTAVGMVMFGVAVVRERRGSGSVGAAALGFGVVNLVQMALAPTDLFHVGIIAYGAGALWLMVADLRQVGSAVATRVGVATPVR